MIPYKHEPFTDFSLDENKDALNKGFETIKKDFGSDYPLIINGERIHTDKKLESYNPAKKSEIIGNMSQAGEKEALQAMDAAKDAFKDWRKTTFEFRSDVLFKAAAIVRKRKFEFTAMLVKEAGKPWKEADADTAEAIDFLEYYARQNLELKDGRKVESRPGEYNRFDYIPLGVGLVISPWNFAFAIMAGTTAAALVTGNTVLLKPSSKASVIAYKFIEVLEEAGMPKGVVNFIPG